jgi:TolB-like protein/Tfp pilus assembly protein PilF
VNPGNFFAELKRRNVYRAAVAYAAVAWLVLQIATQTLPFFGTPAWTVRLIIVVLLAGFPLAMIWAWVFEWTPKGIVRTDEVPPGQSIAWDSRRTLDFIIITVLALAVALLLFDRFRHPSVPEDSGTPAKSIAVLPFANLSANQENAFFSNGVQDEILTYLAKVADLKVISRTSVMQYKTGAERNLREIGKQLGVAHLLEGSVQRSANRVRVNAQLIDARTDAHLWAQTYDRELADVFAIQSEIAQHIADQLRAKLSPSEKNAIASKPTRDLAAYDLYLRANQLLHNKDPRTDWNTDEKVKEGLALLDKSIALDPKFALAYCQITGINLLIYWSSDKSPFYRTRADASLQKAIELAPDAGETHLARAAFYYYGNLDYDHALEELELAARTLPNNVEVITMSARIERRLGRWTEAARHFRKAAELDPRNVSARAGMCGTYTMMRRYREAITAADRAIADFPDSATTFRLLKGEAALQSGDLKTARAALDAIPETDRDDANMFLFWFSVAVCERNFEDARRAISSRLRFPHRESLAPDALFEGEVARAEGDTERANSAFLEARNRSDTLMRNRPSEPLYLMQAALADAALDRREEALREIQKALDLTDDPLQRPLVLLHQAMVYCRLNDRDRALSQLEELARIPNGIDYGSLRFDPEWDGLRGDPRFEKIVASLAPPPAK